MKIYFIAAALVLCTAGPLQAEDDAVMSAYKEFVAAEKSGDKKKALAASERALTLAIAEGPSAKRTGVLAANYARQLSAAGRDADAAKIFDQCAEILAAFEEALADRLSCRVGAGDSYVRGEDYEAAHERYRAVIADGEPRAPENPEIALTVGEAYLGLTIYGETLPVSDVPRATIGSGETSSRIIRRPSQSDADLREVKRNAERALAMFELAGAADSVSYASALRVLGAATTRQGDPAAAVEYYKKSADILAAKVGETDSRTIAMRGRQKLTEYEVYIAKAEAAPPISRQPSGPDCKLKLSAGVEMEACVELRIPPYFPNSELYKGQQGFALIRYDINVKGATENLEVVIDWPGGIFTEKAVKAVSKWKYTPPTDPQGKVGRIEDIETMVRYIIR